MVRARGRFYVLFSPEYDRLDRRRRRECISAARDALDLARDLYSIPGIRTAITARSVPPGGEAPIDLRLHLPEWAPDRLLRGRESTAWFDARTGIVDYLDDPSLGAKDMESLLEFVEDLSRKLDD